MSKPPFLTLPAVARATTLRTPRGDFAAHLADPGAAPEGPVLLVPGYTGSKEDFIALLAPLAGAGHRVLAYDQAGQFESRPGADRPDRYRLDALAEDLLAVAAAFSPGRPPHLLGHSFGGLVARAAVLAEPSAFASVVLLSSGPGRVSDGESARLRMLLAALPLLPARAIWAATQRLAAGKEAQTGEPPAVTAPDVAAFLERRWLATSSAGLAVMGRQLLDEPDRVDALAATGLPRLVVSGERDDTWPVPMQAAMAVRLGASHRVVEGAGHSPNADRPEATAAVLADFWRHVSETVDH